MDDIEKACSKYLPFATLNELLISRRIFVYSLIEDCFYSVANAVSTFSTGAKYLGIFTQTVFLGSTSWLIPTSTARLVSM